MKRLFLIFIMALLAVMPAWADSNINVEEKPLPETKTVAQFAKVIDDLPLMPGLTPEENDDVLFVAGQDRIAQTAATGSVAIDDVYHFYRRTLPQLGWKVVDVRTFDRDNERLRIEAAEPHVGSTVVRFSIEPLGKAE